MTKIWEVTFQTRARLALRHVVPYATERVVAASSSDAERRALRRVKIKGVAIVAIKIELVAAAES